MIDKIKAFFCRLKTFFINHKENIKRCCVCVTLALFLLFAFAFCFRKSSSSASAASSDSSSESSIDDVYLNLNTILCFSSHSANYQNAFAGVPLNLKLVPLSSGGVSVYAASYDSSGNFAYRLASSLSLPSFFVDTSYLDNSTSVVSSQTGNISVTFDSSNSNLKASYLPLVSAFSFDYNNRSSESLKYAIDIYLKSSSTTLGYIRLVFSGFAHSPSIYHLEVLPSVISSTSDSVYLSGYNDGYNKGLETSLGDISPWNVLVDGLDSFFNIKLFGSISIGTIFRIGVSTLLIGFIIKIFLGG